jgi:hypothetical protein
VSAEHHRELQGEAIAFEAAGHRALMAGDAPTARDELRAASDRYRASWDAAPPDAYGRLVGMLKAAILAGDDAETTARFVHSAIGDEPPSPTAAYAVAIAALVHGDDALALRAAEAMRGASDPFTRAADAIAALAGGDEDAFRAAVEAIVADFAARDEHLTGVPIADTAAMLLRLAAARGRTVDVRSPLLPPV